MCMLSHAQLFVTLWTVAQENCSPLSMGFSRQEYWGGLPFPHPDIPDPGTEPMSLAYPALTVDSLPLAPYGKLLFWPMSVQLLQHHLLKRLKYRTFKKSFCHFTYEYRCEIAFL